MNCRSTLSIWLVVPLIFASALLHAATYYVSPNGTDSANGTSLSNAWQTIQHGLNTVAPGDTLVLTNGYFPEPSPYTKIDGTPTQPITVIAAVNQQTVLTNGFYLQNQWYVVQGFKFIIGTNGAFGAGQFLGIWGPNANHNVVISNLFTCEGSTTAGCQDAVCWGRYNGTYTTNGAYNTVIYNVWTNLWQSNDVDLACVGLQGHDNLVISNWAYNCIDIDFCDFFGYSNRFAYNYCTNVSTGPLANHNDMFQTWGDGPSNGGNFWNIIEANTLVNCNSHFYLDSPSGGINVSNTIRNNLIIGGECNSYVYGAFHVFVNNTYYQAGGDVVPSIYLRGDSIRGFASNNIVENNIFSEGFNGNADCPIAASDPGVTNNILDYNFIAMAGGQMPKTVYGTHNVLGGYPNFVNTNSWNFHLASTSRCIGTGTNLASLVSLDFAGLLRGTGPTFDLGAYLTSSQPPPPTGLKILSSGL